MDLLFFRLHVYFNDSVSAKGIKLTLLIFLVNLCHFLQHYKGLFLVKSIRQAMHTLQTIHNRHVQLLSEGSFLKRELNFLLKILKNCYSSAVDPDRIKLQDAYWRNFEQNIENMNHLLQRIKEQETYMATFYRDKLENSSILVSKEEQFQMAYEHIAKEVKVLKESFYSFMDGCNACTRKTH